MSDQSSNAATSAKPKDAATLVVLDRSSGELRILMGRRRPEQVFLPNKYVFPGGGVDRIDRTVPSANELRPDEQQLLLLDMKGHASRARARALALAAIRETYEEAGVLIGAQDGDLAPTSDHDVWASFFSHGVVPSLTGLTFFARAITPPGRPRRYDTRFFFVDAGEIAKSVAPLDDELLDIDWFNLREVRSLDLPNITRAVVEDLADRLGESDPCGSDDPSTWLAQRPVSDGSGASKGGWGPAAVPFYYFKGGSFERVLLSSDTGST